MVVNVAVVISFFVVLAWMAINAGALMMVATRGQKPSALALTAWLIQGAGAFTGPFNALLQPLAILLGATELRRIRSDESPQGGWWPAMAAVAGGTMLCGMLVMLVVAAFVEVKFAT